MRGVASVVSTAQVVGCALALAACGPDPEEAARHHAAALRAREAGGAEPEAAKALAPPPPAPGSGHAKKIRSRDDVKLRGDRVDGKPDDWVLEDDRSVAVVSKRGVLVDFGPHGGVDAMTGTEPTVFATLGAERLEPPTFEVTGEGSILHEKRLIAGKKARYDAFFSLRGGVLFIESLVTATGDEPLVSEVLGEMIGWGNVPTWIEGVGFASSTARVGTAFVGRESLGVAYALESTDGHTFARISALESNGFHDAPYLADRPMSVAARTSSPRRTVALAWSLKSVGDAALALPQFGAKSSRVVKLPAGVPVGTAVEIARCEEVEHPAAFDAGVDERAGRSASGDDRDAKKHAKFDKIVTRFAWDAARTDVRIPEGCHGIRFTALGRGAGPWTSVDDLAAVEEPEALYPKSGKLHIKITEKGKDGTMPGRVRAWGTGGTKAPFWGDDPVMGAALDTIYSDGETTIDIPTGTFTLYVHRGFEYTFAERKIEVTDGATTEVAVELERVVDTTGWISADCHVHAAPSPDAPSPLPDRVRSLAASGVEVAVATDHNKVTDYGPAIRELKLEPFIASIIGDEITTKEPALGHFNTFPLPAGSPPVPFEKITPPAMAAAARGAGKPGLVPILQVNHPRMGGIGYFDILRFDPDDVARWKDRSNIATLDFDTIELFNGDHYADIGKVEAVMKDWYALLKAGFHPVATGNSDSHKLTFAEAGVPRNYVRVQHDDPAAFDEADFVSSMKAGHVEVVSGPFIRFTADGKDIGDDVPEGDVELDIKVDAAPWVDVSEVDLVVKGEIVDAWKGPFDSGVRRFDKKVTRRLARGEYALVIARGKGTFTFLHRSGGRPFSFTNPIFVR